MINIGLDHVRITKKLLDIMSEEFLKEELETRRKTIIDIYIIDAHNLASRDIGSESDTYILIELGNKVFDYSKEYQDDEHNPQFFKHVRIVEEIPGCPGILIKLMDKDLLFGDDLIGQTVVELEDRFYSQYWRSIV